ncbi:YheC/YheD family protein [Alicyclobacillus sp. SO9]|uniref:YheC/YheD family protein n=1 Tax=Alicyclobacillus sp. SO9 TaxID=2665646 RepID=UPI0018E742D7|nr:YheC/YheD family protein [Alicyclobacillus sp. SO9]QQE77408.1 YheC/YheD family protein [Alicyclobacillus sp. SO9]
MARKPELGKLLLWRLFSRSKTLRSYLPATARYTPSSFASFMSKYSTVYVKPSGGSQGIGVIKAWKRQGAFYVKHTVRKTKVFSSAAAAAAYVDKLRNGKGYIVQQGINLASIKGRAFDIRVMVQKTKPGGEWTYSGMLAKVAGPASVVTNVALSKGRVMELEPALKQSLGWSHDEVETVRKRLIRLSLVGARHFDTYQPYREIGFDWAIDKGGRLWLLEENTGPSHRLFAKLNSNKALYRQIQLKWGRYQKYVKKRSVT